jgi:hypothetical protein
MSSPSLPLDPSTPTPTPTRRQRWGVWMACVVVGGLVILLCVTLMLLFLWPPSDCDYPKNLVVLKLDKRTRKLTWKNDDLWRALTMGRVRHLAVYVAYLQRALDALPDQAPICGEWLINVYDGHRERIEPHSHSRTDLPRLVHAEPHQYSGRIEINSPSHEQPVFSMPVLAFCAHDNDATCSLLPDLYMERDRGIDALEQKVHSLLCWSSRIPKLVWRGGLNGRARKDVFITKRHLWANQADASSIFDMGLPSEVASLTISQMSIYQLQFDVDGETNAWDALRWKLLSGSLVIKLRSHWKQWYYDDLIDGTHYVGIDKIEQLAPLVRYYLAHPAAAERIGAQGRTFALARLNDTRCQVDIVRTLRRTAFDASEMTRSNGKIRCLTMQEIGDPRWGRFGNQLFQYMFFRCLAWEQSVHTRFTSNWIGQQLFPGSVRERAAPNNYALRQPCIVRGEKDFLLHSSQWTTANRQDRFQLNEPVHPPIVDLKGFFQLHTSHFKPHRARICALFQPHADLHARLTTWSAPLFQGNHLVLAVHIRRGDYGPPPFLRTPVAWYVTWIKHMASSQHSGKRLVVYVASDDDAVTSELENQLPSSIQLYDRKSLDLAAAAAAATTTTTATASVAPSSSTLPALLCGSAAFYPDFWIMTQAQHVATSNSTFSVAACMLNQRPDATFVRPRPDIQALALFDAWSTAPFIRPQ